MRSPFKFLDSYTKDDKDIFFGRDREIEEMYQKVFESKMLLVYGISGTGKTSLINCGLANKFEDSDWLPVGVRRGRNILESLERELGKVALSDLKSAVDPPSLSTSFRASEGQSSPQSTKKDLTPGQIVKVLKSIYLDHFKPVYLIFDQFEELFIFGDREERDQFIQIVKAVVDSDVQCRFIFSIREEYLAGVTEFERLIPEFLANRMRIEKMTSKNAIQVIEGPCKVHNIEVEEGFSEALLNKLNPDSNEVELTYLQVFLDKVFRLATDKDKEKPCFTNDLLEQIGDVTDLLGSFLEEQISALDDPETGLTILKSFVSVKGTKRQVTLEDVSDFAITLGKKISEEKLKNLIIKFVNLRILRDKDENGRYELRHDGLATKIYEKITLVEKELLEVRQFIDNAYANYEKRNVYLSVEDLKYIAPYEDKLFLNQKLEIFINNSKKEVQKAKRRRRNIVIGASISLFLIMSVFSIWALNERAKAVDQKHIAEEQKNEAVRANKEAELANEQALSERNKAITNEQLALNAQDQAEKSRNEAINAREIVTRELYANIRNSLSVSPEAMNVLFVGVSNPINITASGIKPENLIVKATNGRIEKGKTSGFEGSYIAYPSLPDKPFTIKVRGISNNGDTIDLGNKDFRVRLVPKPYATFANSKGGIILKETALQTNSIVVKLDIDFNIYFMVKGFEIDITYRGFAVSESSNNKFITPKQRGLIDRLNHGDRLVIMDIQAVNPDGRIHNLAPIVLEVFSYKDVIETKAYQEMYEGAMVLYNEANKIQDKKKTLKYLIRSSEILDSLANRRPADYLRQIEIYNWMYSINNSNEYIENIADIYEQCLNYNWNANDIDSLSLLDVELLHDGAYHFYYKWRIYEEISSNSNLTEIAIQLYRKIIEADIVSTEIMNEISWTCSNFSWYLIELKQFENALQAALLAKEANPSFLHTYTNLALSYLFTDQFEKAKEVYLHWKDEPLDEPFDEQLETLKDEFLMNIGVLEIIGITHPDFEKVRELLEQ